MEPFQKGRFIFQASILQWAILGFGKSGWLVGFVEGVVEHACIKIWSCDFIKIWQGFLHSSNDVSLNAYWRPQNNWVVRSLIKKNKPGFWSLLKWRTQVDLELP